MQRLVGVGTIKVCSGDKTMGDFEIKNIKRPKATKELFIRSCGEAERYQESCQQRRI